MSLGSLRHFGAVLIGIALLGGPSPFVGHASAQPSSDATKDAAKVLVDQARELARQGGDANLRKAIGLLDSALVLRADSEVEKLRDGLKILVGAPTPAMTNPATQTSSKAAPKHLDRKTVEFAPGVTAEFVYIDAPAVAPDGFMMGSPAGEEERNDAETQFRAVLTKGYWMQTTEVTQGQWQAVMGNNPADFKDPPNRPVENVSWDDCQQFVSQLRQRGIIARLPTEAEWEFACRAGTTTPFSTGATISTSQANFNGDYTYGGSPKGQYRERTTPVATFPANPWGLHDMHGNVWEWCSDWYGNYPAGQVTNPTGTQTGIFRVLRGGSWDDGPWTLRSAFRFAFSPSYRINNIGFPLRELYNGFRLTLDSE